MRRMLETRRSQGALVRGKKLTLLNDYDGGLT